jgi:hypothetical protein
VEAPAGSTAQRAANEDDPGFYPLWVIYGGHCPPWLRVGQSFPPDRYTYEGGWDIYAAGSPPPQAWPLQPAKPPELQSRLRHGKVIFATSTLRR